MTIAVIGAGHNGLIAALRLAKKGRKVVVFESTDQPGGLCARREFHQGFSVPGLLHDQGMLAKTVVADLGLESFGLELRDRIPPFAPGLGDHGITLDSSGIGDLRSAGPTADHPGFERWQAQLDQLAAAISPLLESAPLALHPQQIGDWWQLLTRGLSLRTRGRETMVELIRLAPMCVADWLGEFIDDRGLIELLAGPAVENSFAGPWSAGTAINLILERARAGHSLPAGPAGLVDALMRACDHHGVEIRCQQPVRKISVDSSGKVRGVQLDGVDEIPVSAVLATCAPQQTFLKLVEPGHFDLRFEDAIRNLRCRGTAAKMHLALSEPLRFGDQPRPVVRLGGGDVDLLERAFDDCKYSRLPTQPHLDIRLPSLTDPSLAPAEHHVASILVSFVAPELAGDDLKQTLATTVLDRIEQFIPNVRDQVIGSEIVLPSDIAAELAIPGGHLHHVEPALDQLMFMRPSFETARYATPIEGLFVGGSGSHPGGGLNGLPGWLAADALDRKTD